MLGRRLLGVTAATAVIVQILSATQFRYMYITIGIIQCESEMVITRFFDFSSGWRVKSDGGGSDWKRLESREGRKLMQKR
jgi:hypothetical protein